ncbi:MAG: hypothetical protein ACK4G1_04435 [Ignavibacteria bacterium]
MKKIFLQYLVVHFLSVVILFAQDTTNSYRVVPLKSGELLISSKHINNSKSINLFVHLHGKASVVQSAFLKSNIDGFLITIHLGMFSGSYRKAFSDSNFFETILNETLNKLKDETEFEVFNKELKIFLASFSAGYGGIREILNYEKYYNMINGILLLDGLHTDYIETEKGKYVNPIQMNNFLRFARDAVVFKKQFIITHSEIIPEGYSSTTETAQYLLDSTGTEKIFAERVFDDSFIQKCYAFNGNFRVFGFYGDKAQDHMRHLYNIDKFLRMFDY